MITTTFQSGAELDNRPEEKKAKDYFVKETIATVAVVDWKEKPETLWRKFPDQEQDGSGSCVAQSSKKMTGIQLWLENNVYLALSATSVYQKRSNKPSGGMIGIEAFDILMKNGITLEELAQSENMTDMQMDSVKIPNYADRIGEIFKIGGHVGIDNGDFDTVASVIQTTGKGVMVWFFFNAQEWSSKEPVILDPTMTPGNAWGRHSVVATDFFLVNGKEYLLIEDSAHFGGLTRRIISREFFKARNFFARYPMNFVFNTDQTAPVKPKFTFNVDMQFGQTNENIKALQDCLKFEGVLPINIASSGYFGAITKKAVQTFQLNHSITTADSVGYGRVGPKTRAVLNSIYG